MTVTLFLSLAAAANQYSLWPPLLTRPRLGGPHGPAGLQPFPWTTRNTRKKPALATCGTTSTSRVGLHRYRDGAAELTPSCAAAAVPRRLITAERGGAGPAACAR